MAKTLLETYRELYEANKFRAQAAGLGAAPAAPSPNPVDAKAQGFPARPAASPSTSGTSTAFGGRPAPSDAINNLGRVSQKPEARPLPMGGSVPGRQVNSTMIAARSPNMQGRPAGSPTSAVTVDKKVTSTGNPNTAGGIAPVRPAAPVSRTPGRGGNTGGRYGMQSPEISKAADQPYNMKIPTKSPTLKAQTDGKIGGKYDIAPDKKPLAKPADQPYNMKIPTMSPTLKAQTDGKITSKQPADQDIARRKARIQAIRRPVNTDSNVPLSNTSSAAAAEPNGEKPAGGIPPKPTLKPNTTKKQGVVKKPNASAKPAIKPQAAGTQNNMTPAQRAIINRRVERGNARPGEEPIGLGVKTKTRTGSVSSNRLKKRAPIGQNQKNLGEMVANLINQKLEERHTFAGAARSQSHNSLGELGSRRGDEKQKMDLLRYQKVVRKRLAEEEAEAETKQPKKIKHKKGTPVNLDPETNSTNPSY